MAPRSNSHARRRGGRGRPPLRPTTRSTGPLARLRSPRPVNVSVMRTACEHGAVASMNEGRPTIRDHFLEAVLWFVQAATQLPGVQRIALIGSILTNRPSPKDVDLVVYIAADADLAPLASLARRLKGRLQSHNRGADV